MDGLQRTRHGLPPVLVDNSIPAEENLVDNAPALIGHSGVLVPKQFVAQSTLCSAITLQMTDYRMRVDEAISSGKLWRAKEILQGRLGNSGYDAELFRLYGSVLKQMGDLRTAGRYLFLSGSRTSDHDECINIFRDRDCNRPFPDFWKAMPKTVKKLSKDEIPDDILEEIIHLGFDRAEVDAVFAGIEKRIAGEKADTAGKAD